MYERKYYIPGDPKKEGTCLNINKGMSGRRRTVTTPETIKLIRNSLKENGLRSARRNGLDGDNKKFFSQNCQPLN